VIISMVDSTTGPIRGTLGQFPFLLNIHGDISI